MKNFGGVAVPLAVAALVGVLPYAVLTGVRIALVSALSTAGSSDGPTTLLVSAGIGVLAVIVLMVSQAYALSGMTLFALRVARGERPELGVVFSGGRFFAPMLGATFLVSLGVGLGNVLCLLPGFFLAGSWLAYSAFIIDKGLGPIEAISASWRAMAPYRVNAFVYFLLVFLAGIAGSLACCVGGLLISTPMAAIGNAYIFLKLTGEQPRLAP